MRKSKLIIILSATWSFLPFSQDFNTPWYSTRVPDYDSDVLAVQAQCPTRFVLGGLGHLTPFLPMGPYGLNISSTFHTSLLRHPWWSWQFLPSGAHPQFNRFPYSRSFQPDLLQSSNNSGSCLKIMLSNVCNKITRWLDIVIYLSKYKNRSGNRIIFVPPVGYLFFFFISWRLITLQYWGEFCHILKRTSHGFTCVPHPDPPSHLPLHPIPLGLPSAPGLSTCLVHPTWSGDLFHPR